MKKLNFRLAILIIFSMISVGCVTQTKYVVFPLSLPNKDLVPKVTGEELVCLSDATKMKLLERDKILKGYIRDLETTIKFTWKDKTK